MHLKQLLFVLVLIGSCLAPSLAQQQSGQDLRALNDVALVTILQRKFTDRGWEDSAIVIEGAKGLKNRYPEFVQFSDLMQRDWRTVSSDVMNANPGPLERAFLLVAARGLPPEKYRDFLDTMLDETEAGRLLKSEMIWAIFPPYPRLGGIWVRTYGEQRTINSVRRVQRLFADDPGMQIYCRTLLTGEMMRAGEEVARQMENPGPSSGGLQTRTSEGARPPSARKRPTNTAQSMSGPTAESESGVKYWVAGALMLVAAISLLLLLFGRRK